MTVARKFVVVMLWVTQLVHIVVVSSYDSQQNGDQIALIKNPDYVTRRTKTTSAPTTFSPLPEVKTAQLLDIPLDRRLCRDPLYRNLRACTESRADQEEYGRNWLCSNRDVYMGNDIPVEEAQGSSRSKRSILNPCSGQKIRVAVLVATDEDGNVRELVIDRANNLYQTIIIEECALAGANNLECQPHNITFEAAVFDVDPASNNISLQDVSTQAYCALSFSL